MDEIQHYGMPRRSGRYPWGSGDDPYQDNIDILVKIDEMKANGITKETEIAKALGMNTSELRAAKAWANSNRKRILMDSITSRAERGMNKSEIARDLNISEGSVRDYLKKKDSVKLNQLDNITKQLEYGVEQNGYLDVGVGVEKEMGISRSKLKAAEARLKEKGYYEHEIYVRRLNDYTKWTTVKVLTKEPDIEVVKQNSDKIRSMHSWTDDGGLSWQNLGPIQMIDSNRIEVRYAEDGGADKDGLIEMRRNVEDLDLGKSKYAQVRIGVDDSHFLKGMAMYTDDIPKGKDIVFNTNKSKDLSLHEVLKPLKDNPDNRFGATIKNGGQRGALNIVNEEGDWNEWSTTLSSQFLAKQPLKLVKERMDTTFKSLQEEYGEISTLTNPVVKSHLLEAYTDGLTAKTQHLKAKALPKSKGHVLLPFPDMDPNEIYAPNYNDGDRVVTLRYPHGGTFELAELTVNNKGPARKLLGNATDAVGIHPSVAQKMSGADFDGDTAYIIPNNKNKVKVSRSLKELKNFDPNEYHVPVTIDKDGNKIKTISNKMKQRQMGEVSNLITDMTIKGASQGEIANAVKHSMVIIDSEKHNLDWRKSADDNRINALKKKWQTHINPLTGNESKGASTLLSLSKRESMEGGYEVEVVDKNGMVKTKMKGGTSTPIVDLVGGDAHKLSSGTAVEGVYADYINKVKSLQNTAQKELATVPKQKYDREAYKAYKPEVDSLVAKLDTALQNAPRERQAQIQASKTFYEKWTDDMDKDQVKKLKNQALIGARAKVGADRKQVDITPKEWEAIQAGAVSNDRLKKILRNADMDKVKKMATPKPASKLSSAKATRARGLLDRGYTYAEVANAVGMSPSGLRSALEEDE